MDKNKIKFILYELMIILGFNLSGASLSLLIIFKKSLLFVYFIVFYISGFLGYRGILKLSRKNKLYMFWEKKKYYKII